MSFFIACHGYARGLMRQKALNRIVIFTQPVVKVEMPSLDRSFLAQDLVLALRAVPRYF